MNEIFKDSFSKEIFHKIKLFTNEKYFKLFAHILTKKSKNFSAFEKISSLAISIDNFNKEKILKNSRNCIKQITKKKKINFHYGFKLLINQIKAFE